MPFASVINVSALNGVNGFQLSGAGEFDSAGYSGQSIGDFNGDGFADLILGGWQTTFDPSATGHVYVVFGRAGGFAANLNLGALDGSNGFRVNAAVAGQEFGQTVSAAGDVNNDGFDDFLIGAKFNGDAYLVLGTGAAMGPVFSLADLDGSNGSRLHGPFGSMFGGSLVAIGDMNGDGRDDFMVGASGQNVAVGAAFVVFGSDGGLPADLNLQTLDGTNGFQIAGVSFFDVVAYQGAAAGDFNDDGFADLILGSPTMSPNGGFSGGGQIIFGHAGPYAPVLSIADLDGSNGLRLNGAAAEFRTGSSVSGAADFNGDGIDDIMIVAGGASSNGLSNNGAVYVVYGRTDGVAAIELGALDGTNGFRILGPSSNPYQEMVKVAAIGDINGDGFDELMVGIPHWYGAFGLAGGAYIVYGRAGMAAEFDLAAFTAADGVRIFGEANFDALGAVLGSAGDVNGDGLDDLLLSTFRADPNGHYSGAAWVILASTGVVQTAGPNGGALSGGVGDDTLTGLGGRDILSGGDGDDLLEGGDGGDTLLGGEGEDRLSGGVGADTLDGGAGADRLAGDEGADKIAGGEGDDRLDGGTGTDRLEGGAGRDRLEGGEDNDYLDGGTGADEMFGFTGNDVYIVDSTADRVFEKGGGYDIVRSFVTWTLGFELEGLQLQGSANLNGTGNELSNNIQGNSGANTLKGGDGNDTMDGGDGGDFLYGEAGGDILSGGLGNDLLEGGAGADKLDGGDGADKLHGGSENDQIVGGLGADQLDGGSGNDNLSGGEGNDALDGGAGNDAMAGGAGNDVYLVDSQFDTLIEQADEGADIVRTGLSWVLGANFETLQLQGSAAVNGTGNDLANNIQGNSGANTLSGLGGVDSLNGLDGADAIIGGRGNDLLRGGAGADRFVVLQESVGNAVLETDQIFDFSTAEGDVIDISAIHFSKIASAFPAEADGGPLEAKVDLDVFQLVGAFTKARGEMTLSFAGGVTTLKLDVNGDAKADYQLKINGDVTGDSAGWLL